MRKCILATLVLLGLLGVAHAAYWQGQTYKTTSIPRVQKNLVTDYGATCNSQSVSRTVTITNSGSGLRDVAVTVNTFVSGDVGKRIAITGAGGGGNIYSGTIAAFVDAQHITLGSNASVALSASSQTVLWGTNDTAAFLSFKAAFQGTTPVQLNLPGMCSWIAGGGTDFWMFRGIQNYVVDGGGIGGITNLGDNPLFMGGVGQYQDSNHSLRTDTAVAGDSCVIAKTQPAVTVSDVQNNRPLTAKFTASISGTTMTVTAVTSGSIPIGAFLNGGVSSFTKVVSQSTGSPGSTGDYVVSISQTVSPAAPLTTTPATFTATVDAAGVMTVSAIADGSLAPGMWVYRQSGSIGKPTSILSQLTGTAGSTGTYQLSNAPLSALATPSDFIGNGVPRVTLNSTTGLSTGDTLFLTGMNGTSVFPQRVNGLQWIKVIDATHIDLFQVDFNGAYTSGGTGGGDRTSLTPVGSKVLMTGWNNQSYWASPFSFPSNPHWFEYKTVASTNSTTHQICFDTPLVDTYKSTWPQMNTGSQFEIDPGGPATLYVLLDWELTAVFQNLTIDSTLQTYSQGRNVTFNNTVMTGFGCPIPTQNETFVYINVTGTNCTMETDKIVKTWNITNSTLRKVHLQSSSIETINIDGLTIGTFNGTSKRFIANNLTTTCSFCTPGSTSEASFQVGVGTYGVTDEVVLTNSSIGGPSGSTAGNGFEYSVPFPEVNNPNHPWSMSGGVITIPNGLSWSGCCGESELQVKTIVPGHYVFWQAGLVGRALKIIDVTQDVDNIYVQTSEAGGFPTGTWTSSPIKLIPHPAPKFTMTNVTGVISATAYNGCTAQAPIFSCANYTRTGGASGSTPTRGPTIWGELSSFTFTNSVPYTNTGSLSWTVPQFATFGYLTTSNAITNVNFSINTKLPSSGGGGTRTFTPSGVTGNQTGDSFPSAPPAGAVFGGGLGLSLFSADTPSDSPEVTVTLRTDQHLPP